MSVFHHLEEPVNLKYIYAFYLDIIATKRIGPVISGCADSPFFKKALDVSLAISSSQLWICIRTRFISFAHSIPLLCTSNAASSVEPKLFHLAL